jgi:glutathione synthase/RimK-type ligase-like ATP-grasp enzyme
MRAERSKLRVLLLDGHTRQVLPMAEALRQSGHWVEVVCHSRFDMGYVSRWPQRRWLAPDPKLEPEAFAGEVESILRQGGIDVVIPLFDYGAETAARCKPEWSRYSRVAVNDWPVFQLARNKLQTMRFCMHHDIPCPRTVLDEEPTTLDHLTFPLVVKPQRGVSAAGFHRVDRVEDLPAIIDSTRIAHGPVLVQEYIPQTDLQYKAEVFMDTEGTVKAAVVFSKVRWHPVAGGSSTLNITVSRPDIIETCVRMLRAMGWIGYADVDLTR